MAGIFAEVQGVAVAGKLEPILWRKRPRQKRSIDQAIVFQKAHEHRRQNPGDSHLRDLVFDKHLERLRGALDCAGGLPVGVQAGFGIGKNRKLLPQILFKLFGNRQKRSQKGGA